MLVMLCTPTQLTLFLCWPINATKHVTIKMCEVDGEPDHFAKFFAALKVAVDSIDEIKGLGGAFERCSTERMLEISKCLQVQ